MEKYRIVETTVSGNKNYKIYTVQKRFLFFWFYLEGFYNDADGFERIGNLDYGYTNKAQAEKAILIHKNLNTNPINYKGRIIYEYLDIEDLKIRYVEITFTRLQWGIKYYPNNSNSLEQVKKVIDKNVTIYTKKIL